MRPLDSLIDVSEETTAALTSDLETGFITYITNKSNRIPFMAFVSCE